MGAAIEFRKHLGWYVKGLPNSAELRQRLHQVKDFAEVEAIFSGYLAAGPRAEAPSPDEPDPMSLTCEVG